jgi:hypothetical protein
MINRIATKIYDEMLKVEGMNELLTVIKCSSNINVEPYQS